MFDRLDGRATREFPPTTQTQPQSVTGKLAARRYFFAIVANRLNTPIVYEV